MDRASPAVPCNSCDTCMYTRRPLSNENSDISTTALQQRTTTARSRSDFCGASRSASMHWWLASSIASCVRVWFRRSNASSAHSARCSHGSVRITRQGTSSTVAERTRRVCQDVLPVHSSVQSCSITTMSSNEPQALVNDASSTRVGIRRTPLANVKSCTNCCSAEMKLTWVETLLGTWYDGAVDV